MTTRAEAAVGAKLSGAERAAIERALSLMDEQLGDELLAVWLYGSRARGEAREESDIDLLVVTAWDSGRRRPLVHQAFETAAFAEGVDPFAFSVFVYDPAGLAELRASDSFYIRNVERERLVLAGSPEGEIPGLAAFEEHVRARYAALGLTVKPRTHVFLEKAREKLDSLDWGEGRIDNASLVSIAYYAMLYAARAALSEDDLEARRHAGTWQLFRERFVLEGRFDPLLAKGSAVQELREDADYGAESPDDASTAEALARARRFVRGIEKLLGEAPPF